jgi:hypothetical protein
MTSLGTCVVCNEGMLLVEQDQITHPCCDPDDTPQPVLSVDEITELFNSSEWLRLSERPGRCTHCGSHPATQGHLAECESKEAQQHLFANSPICKDCGDPLGQPGLTQRCRGLHQTNGRKASA